MVSGYIPVFAVALTGTEGMFDWFTAHVTSANCMIIENKFTGSITTDITIRIYYMKL